MRRQGAIVAAVLAIGAAQSPEATSSADGPTARASQVTANQWTGRWIRPRSEFGGTVDGVVTFSQAGSVVTGTYSWFGGGQMRGTVSGSDGRTLRGTYSGQGDGGRYTSTRGRFDFTLAPDGRSFAGTFTVTGGQFCCVTGGHTGRFADAPPPQLARTAVVEPRSGTVLVALPRTSSRSAVAAQARGRFVRLRRGTRIPFGSVLDTNRGTVALTSARDRRGNVQSGDFGGGRFTIRQVRSGLTDLTLSGGTTRGCVRGSTAAVAARRRYSRRRIRRLRANARGRFRTRGRYSAATVRGTVWTTTDRCDGTLTSVRRGSVVVRDNRRRRNIVLRAGRSYLARAPG